MGKNTKKVPRTFGKKNQRGSLLIGLLAAVVILAVPVASIAFYLVYSAGPMDRERTHWELERVGTLVMEGMVAAIREGKTTDLKQDDTFYPNLMIIYPDASRRCFKLGDNDIKEGPDYDNLSPLEILDDSYTVRNETRTHRIICDDLRFKREGERVIIRFSLRHDVDNGNGPDDLTVSFGSAVKLRG
jgi:hypothetical protein